jgi:5-methylcytosine-specific restriction endonuclease McrA
VRAAVLLRDRGRCVAIDALGRRCTSAAVIVDHVVPRKAGGAPLDPRNLRSLCRACDNRRHGEKGGKHD